MPRAAHGTVRGRRLRPAVADMGVRVAPVMVGSAPAIAAALTAGLPRPPCPERRCPMARLRLVLLTLAVAALLLVGTASAALAGLTATAAD
jgi:hypothetical protein